MKMKTTLKLVAAALAVALSPLAQATQVPGVAEQPDSYFYTGKPYDADLGAYTFAYRTYDPEVNRWTSADPSGFPDGANDHRYSPTPTCEIDYAGLYRTSYRGDKYIIGEDSTKKYTAYFEFTLEYTKASISIVDMRLRGDIKGSVATWEFEISDVNVVLAEGPQLKSEVRKGNTWYWWEFGVEGFATLSLTKKSQFNGVELYGFNFAVGGSSTEAKTLNRAYSSNTSPEFE
jgi:RHS repeat-associated protein